MRNTTQMLRNSQQLRREMTKEEKHLWYDFLKSQTFTVNRQKIVGPYILDFYIGEVKLGIELDGSQHYEIENQNADEKRDEYLNKRGIKILRYSNLELQRNFKGVCEDILQQYNERK